MSLFIKSSKTDKYKDASWIMIAKTGTDLCPVTNVSKFICWAKFTKDDYLFCNTSSTKSGYKPRKTNTKMPYTTLR